MKIDRWFWLIPTKERPPKDGPETNRKNNPEKPIRCIRAHVYSLSSSPPSRCASTLLPESSRPTRRFNNLGCYLFFRHRNLIECASESGLHTPSTSLSSFYLTTREMCHLRIRRRAVVTSLNCYSFVGNSFSPLFFAARTDSISSGKMYERRNETKEHTEWAHSPDR